MQASRSAGSAGSIRPGQLFSSWLGSGGSKGGQSAEEESVGIDLGTTNCAIAAVVDGKPTILPAADGQRVWSSVVSFLETAGSDSATAADGDASSRAPLLEPDSPTARVFVGDSARKQQVTNPYSTYASTKRLIGRTATAEELKQLCALDVPHSVSANTREVLLACPALRRAISPVSVAAELVRELVSQAEQQLDRNVTSAVVTVPAYFDDSQRCATETACLLAGLKRVRLLREPEAAALTYALDAKREERVMVFDLGGGAALRGHRTCISIGHRNLHHYNGTRW